MRWKLNHDSHEIVFELIVSLKQFPYGYRESIMTVARLKPGMGNSWKGWLIEFERGIEKTLPEECSKSGSLLASAGTPEQLVAEGTDSESDTDSSKDLDQSSLSTNDQSTTVIHLKYRIPQNKVEESHADEEVEEDEISNQLNDSSQSNSSGTQKLRKALTFRSAFKILKPGQWRAKLAGSKAKRASAPTEQEDISGVPNRRGNSMRSLKTKFRRIAIAVKRNLDRRKGTPSKTAKVFGPSGKNEEPESPPLRQPPGPPKNDEVRRQRSFLGAKNNPVLSTNGPVDSCRADTTGGDCEETRDGLDQETVTAIRQCVSQESRISSIDLTYEAHVSMSQSLGYSVSGAFVLTFGIRFFQ